MNKIIDKAVNSVKTSYLKASNEFMLRQCGIVPEKEEGDQLIEVVGTIAVAVVILLFFREQIIGIFQSAFDRTSTSVDGLFDKVTAPAPAPTP